jgi:hypothetical protein
VHTSSRPYEISSTAQAEGGTGMISSRFRLAIQLEAVQLFCLAVSNEYPPAARGGGWCNAEGLRELRRKLDELEGNDTRERLNPS